MLRRVSEEGYCVLIIQIAPHTAEPFWLRQGFTVLDDDIHFRNGLYAFRTISWAFPLGTGPRVSVQIMFYDESRVYYGGEPFSTFDGEGERLADGSIQLAERVHGYSPLWNVRPAQARPESGSAIHASTAGQGSADG